MSEKNKGIMEGVVAIAVIILIVSAIWDLWGKILIDMSN